MGTIRSRRTIAVIRRSDSMVALDTLARHAGLHPEVVQRLVRLGLVEPHGGTSSAPRFRRQDALRLARAERLRHDLGLNYAGAVLATELLERIEELEQRLRSARPYTDHTR